MTFASASADQSEEGRAFLQRRVGGAGLAGAAGFGGFLLFRILSGLEHPMARLLRDQSMVWHGVAALTLLAMWVVCRGRPLSASVLRGVEAAGMLGATLATVEMGRHLALWMRPEMTVFSALTFGWTARAIYVPSSARRTLLLTAAGGVPLLVGSYASWLGFDAEPWSTIDEEFRGVTPTLMARLVVQSLAAWWLLTTGLCTAASRVIYGLRREVRAARQLGQYTLEAKLGEGGMGMVYRASHAMLRRPTAVKLLLPEKAGAANLLRFEREVQMTAQLSHPNTVRIYDYGRTPEGTFYYAMELLDGATLQQLVDASGPQPPARVLHILQQITSALVEAHGAGMIHRDIKPSNIILSEQGGMPDIAKLVDFGLVKDIDAAAGSAHVTNPEIVTGTPLYMSPESITDSSSVDHRADLYAVGAVAYYLLTGSHVFDGNNLVEVCSQHLHKVPQPPSERLGSELPADIEAIVLACLEKDRADRPADAAALLARLRACAMSGQWTDVDAHQWWDGHPDVLADWRSEQSIAGAGTELNIDFASRAG